MKHFVIVSKQRSGTNHLVKLLDSHDRITCHGEIFRIGFDPVRRIGASLEEFRDIELRRREPEQYVNAIRALAPEQSEAFGFKAFPNQVRPIKTYFANPDLMIIRLVRSNLLATYSSGKIAKLTGQGVVKTHQEARRATIPFDEADFRRFLRSQARQDSWVEEILSSIEEDRIFHLSYTELGNEDALARLQTFIGVTPATLLSDMKKRNPSQIIERFDNPAAVSEFLEREQLTDWTSE